MMNPIGIKLSYQNKQTDIEYIENEIRSDAMLSYDSYMQDDGRYLFYLDGVVLNLNEIFKSHSFETIENLFLAILEEDTDLLLRKLNGSFKLIVIDRTANNSVIATNRIGDHGIYYSDGFKNSLYVSDSIHKLYNFLKRDGISMSLNVQSAYELLTYSFLIHDHTLINECHRLLPGHYLRIKNGKKYRKCYYQFPNEQFESIDYNEAIDKIDELFKNAINLEFEKDKKYTGCHFTTMSGGLDSRMTGLVAHELGYKNQRFFTFSQTNYLDHTIAQEISKDYDKEFSFVPLDHGDFVNKDNLERCIEVLEGQCSFLGGAHASHSFEKVLKRGEFDGGIVHSGQLGDVVVGNYSKSEINIEPKVGDGADSVMLIDRLDKSHINGYSSKEEFMFNNRGFNGVLSCNKYYQTVGQTLSPFLDNDFFDFTLRLPMNFRAFHRIYIDWINLKHKTFAKYKWENTKSYITGPKFVFRNKLFTPSSFSNFLMNEIGSRVGFSFLKKKPSFHMNPFDFWMSENPKIMEFVESYYKAYIHLVKDGSLRSDCKLLMHNGSLSEKAQVLTLLSFLVKFDLK